jgi:DNA helicase-2/ATP-dependent DNA helicase PcrA
MKIASDTHLLVVDRHARVTAGPGAGKTYWLAGHIKNVLRRSKKLHINARVAVISYTNIAAEQLREQLGSDAARTDISTIHSFLYRHIVRSYVHLLRDTTGQSLVNVAMLDGHDEHHVNYLHLRTWLTTRNLQQLLTKFQKKQFARLQEHIGTIHWQQATTLADWRLGLRADYGLSQNTKAHLTTESLLTYKQAYWSEGRIDHDDVLYFALRILSEYPLVRTCLSARFPFIFVDEFQDTVPAQTQIVRWLAEENSTVVVIGDAEQAIFEFAGAAPNHFREFVLPDLDEYEILHNRRSTSAIVSLLNHVRKDGLVQECFRQEACVPVQVFVGTPLTTANQVRKICEGRPLLVLSRNQNVVDELLVNIDSPKDNPWTALADAPAKRGIFLQSVCAAIILARTGRLGTSMKTLRQGIRHENGMLKDPFRSTTGYSALHRRAIAVTILEALLGQGSTLDAMTVRSAYERLSECLGAHFSGLTLIKITGGQFAKTADQLTMGVLLGSVKLDNADEVRDIRTIHKAKGMESDRVLVCLHATRDDRLKHLISPEAPSDEEQRLTYVALSRARDVLFIAVPQLTNEDETTLRNLGMSVSKVN